MNEELSIAIEKLKQKPIDKAWFIAIKLNECEMPEIEIGDGSTLRDIQYVDLNKDWDIGIQQILNIIPSESSKQVNYADVAEKVDNDCVLFRSVNGQHYFIPFQDVRWDSKKFLLHFRRLHLNKRLFYVLYERNDMMCLLLPIRKMQCG